MEANFGLKKNNSTESFDFNFNPNKRYFIVPGFGSELVIEFLGYEKRLYDSFLGLKEKRLSNIQEFKLYPDTRMNVTGLNLINLFILYKKAQRECKSSDSLNRLQLELFKNQPEEIICHSQGCELLENYIKEKMILPQSVKRIIYCQSDSRTISNPIIENVHSSSDIMLLLSIFVNFSIPVGLLGDQNHTKNYKYDLSFKRNANLLLPVGLHLDFINNELR